MSALPANWQEAFRWLTQTWTDPAEPWAHHRQGLLDGLGLADESSDSHVAELFRHVEEDLHSDADRHALLTDESRLGEWLVAAPSGDQGHESAVPAVSDDEATAQGYSTDHEQARRLGIAYWDAENQRYLYHDAATGEWLEEPPSTADGQDDRWDAGLAAELPFAELGDAEIAELFREEMPAGFAKAVAAGEVTITTPAVPAVTGSITDG